MTVLGIAWRSVRQRPLSSVLTAFGVALGVGLALVVLEVRSTGRRAFEAASRGYDVLVGPVHSSPLTTVLSSVFYVGKPTDVVPVEAYDAIKKDPRVRLAIPLATGDTYRGYRVVATSSSFFDALEDADSHPLRSRIRGRAFADGANFEAVVGSLAASRTGLDVGSTFAVTHGLEASKEAHEHAETWTVVGVLEPTGTPNDRIVLIPLESFFHVAGHEKHDGASPGGTDGAMAGGDHDGGENHEGEESKVWSVSAVILRLTSPLHRPQLVRSLKERTDVQPVVPADEITALFAIVEGVDALFRVVAWLVLLVSGIAILVGLLNSIHGRRREIAILRSLGARPAHVFAVLLLEGAMICTAGAVLGVLLAKAGVVAASPWMLENTGVRVAPGLSAADAYAVLLAVGLGAVAAILPGWRALRVPVAENLHPVD